jgi:SLT domain-containing protein
VAGVKKFFVGTGFAAGGIYDYLPPMASDQASDLVSMQSYHLVRETGMALKNIFDSPAYTGAMAGAGVQRWASVVLQALALVGQPASLLQTVLRRMNQESGGNPRAINLWDSNAKRGTPSKGLMQTIDPTFNAYAGELRGRGVWDPLANIYASMRYAMSRYGSLARAYNRAGGYDAGGYVEPGTTMVTNRTGKPEAVLNPEMTDAYLRVAEAASKGEMGGITINIGTVTTPDAATFVKDMKQMARRGRQGRSA